MPTSVAAFVGYSARGVTDTPVQVNSWGDYVRAFGGLDASSPMSYAVYLFFLNGGSTAQVVRAGDSTGKSAPARIALSGDVLLTATSPGSWGNRLQAVVDAKNLSSPKTQFNLTLTDPGSGTTERYAGMSLAAGPQGITSALAASALMHVDASSKLTQLPAAGDYTVPAKAPAGADAADAPAASSPGVDVDAGHLSVPGDPAAKSGIYALANADIFNMLCLPSQWDQTYSAADLSAAAEFCVQRRAMLIVDPPSAWSQAWPPPSPPQGLSFQTVTTSPAITGADVLPNAATYYPNLVYTDQVTGQVMQLGPCGAVAGVWASTDASRGVWKAPAGTAAGINAISGLTVHIDDGESGVLNPLGINCLRTLPIAGPVSWGARTSAGADELASQWKYVPVRRTALFIEESVRRGTQWAVFEPNDEPLWSSIRLNIGAFMNSLFKQGAFQGSTPAEAYLVKCDADINPQNSINQGILNILVGFQPLEPAEFVIIQIEQLMGQLSG